MTPRNHLRNPTLPTGIPLRYSQPTPGTSHHGLWKSRKVEKEAKKGQKRIVVVQGTPHWQRPVGPQQARRSREADHFLIKNRTKPPSKVDSNKNLTLTKDFKSGLLAIKYQSDDQYFLFQFNINAQGNY